eukprot:10869910-Alexandrium_andersonii.AAC.1
MGAGVWIPAGQGQVRLRGDIRNFAHISEGPEGTEAWAGPTGGRPSSARAEAFALMIPMFADGPVRVALDSAAVHRKFQWVCEARRGPRFSWGLTRD